MSAGKGTCLLCKAEITKKSVSAHLDSCPELGKRDDASREEGVFRMLVEGKDSPKYWLCIDAPAHMALKTLDKFLRRIWLECCSHMSAFKIDGITYYPDSESKCECGGEDMKFALREVLRPGARFSYEYDFGTTTELSLSVISRRQGATANGKVEILARNLQPNMKCRFCGKTATQICGICGDSENGITCDACMKKHECGEETFLPIVNSPRTGVCGYCGGPETKPVVERGWVLSDKGAR